MRFISSSLIKAPLHDQLAHCLMFLRSLPFRQAAIRYFSVFRLISGFRLIDEKLFAPAFNFRSRKQCKSGHYFPV